MKDCLQQMQKEIKVAKTDQHHDKKRKSFS